MRVLVAVPDFLPARVGAWLATHRLMCHLVSRGHEVAVFAWQRREVAYELDGITVETGLRGKSHAKTLAARADVVVSHFGDGGAGAVVAAAASRPSVRLAHGGGPHGPMGCDLAVFNSHSLRAAWQYDGASIVVHPPVDIESVRTKPGDCVTLINLSEHKGGALFDSVAREMSDRRFLGVKGGYGTQIAVRHPNVDVIATTGNMRDDVYARTRVLLMPSAYETWGMVGVEAMASGIPVIAHPTPGLRESLGDAGIFVDRNDTRAWINAINALDAPVEYQAASKRAAARVRELIPEMRAGLDRFAQAMEALA